MGSRRTMVCSGASASSTVGSRHFLANIILPTQRISTARSLPRFSIRVLAVKRSSKRLKYPTPRLLDKGDEIIHIKVDPSGSDTWKLDPVVDFLKIGAVGVIPTDTVYAIVCDMTNHSAIKQLRRMKGIETSKPLSILCHSFRDIDTYTLGFPRGTAPGHIDIFRAVKHCLPGPYTFILPASKALPKQCTKFGATIKYASRKTVGVRMPEDAICQAILGKLGSPLICTSVKWPTRDEWMVDPVIIADIFEPQGLDFVVDSGIRIGNPSTVVDMTGTYPRILRLGKGPKQDWMAAEGDEESVKHE